MLKCHPHRFLFILLSFSVATLPGCGMTVQQHAAVRKFSASTVALADLAAEHLTQSRAQIVEMNMLRARLGDQAIDVDPDAPVELNNEALGGLIPARHLEARLAALAALSDYAEWLVELAHAESDDGLRVAVDSLLGSLRRVDAFEVDSGRQTAVGDMVMLAANQIVEAQRADVMRQIVVATEPWIAAIVDSLRRDLDPNETGWAFAYLETVRQLEQAATIAEARDGETAAPAVLEARLVAQRDRSAFERTSRHLTALCEDLRRALINLRGAMQSRHVTLDDLDGLLTRAEAVAEAVAVIRSGN